MKHFVYGWVTLWLTILEVFIPYPAVDKDLIKVIIQSDSSGKLSPKEIGDRYDEIVKNNNPFGQPVNRTTLRVYLTRMQKSGDLKNDNGRWTVLRRFSVQEKSGGQQR